MGTTLNFSQAAGVRPGGPAGGEREPGDGSPVRVIEDLGGGPHACLPALPQLRKIRATGAMLALGAWLRGSGQSCWGAPVTSRPEAQRPLQPCHHTALKSASPHAFPSLLGGLPNCGHYAQYAPSSVPSGDGLDRHAKVTPQLLGQQSHRGFKNDHATSCFPNAS